MPCTISYLSSGTSLHFPPSPSFTPFLPSTSFLQQEPGDEHAQSYITCSCLMTRSGRPTHTPFYIKIKATTWLFVQHKFIIVLKEQKSGTLYLNTWHLQHTSQLLRDLTREWVMWHVVLKNVILVELETLTDMEFVQVQNTVTCSQCSHDRYSIGVCTL